MMTSAPAILLEDRQLCEDERADGRRRRAERDEDDREAEHERQRGQEDLTRARRAAAPPRISSSDAPEMNEMYPGSAAARTAR